MHDCSLDRWDWIQWSFMTQLKDHLSSLSTNEVSTVAAVGVLRTSSLVCAYLKTVCTSQVHCVLHGDLWELFHHSNTSSCF